MLFRKVAAGLILLLTILVAKQFLCCCRVAAADAFTGKKLAFLVGVNNYRHAKLDALQFAERDVEELARVLRKQGYSVVMLTPRLGKDNASLLPNRKNIEERLAELLKDAGRDDQILVALAGHGIQPDGSSDSYYCPFDANPSVEAGQGAEPGKAAFPETLVAITGTQGILRTLDKSGIGRKMLFIDACRNDPESGRGRGVGTAITELPEGTWLLLSCSARQRAWETGKLGGGHGVFFHFVLEGLNGKAADNRGRVTWQRLSEYVTEQVESEVPKIIGDGATQLPDEKRSGGGVPVLAMIATTPDLSPGRATPITPLPTVTPKPTPASTSTPSSVSAPVFHGQLINQDNMPGTQVKLSDSQTAAAKTLRLQVEIENSIGMQLRLIPAGEFLRGSPESEAGRDDNEKQKSTQIPNPFYLGKYEVTQAEFQRVMRRNPSYFSQSGLGEAKVRGLETDRFPVEQVNLYDAVEFCNKLSAAESLLECYGLSHVKRKDDNSIDTATVTLLKDGLGYRLPTESEWEYACRAGTQTPFSYGLKGNGTESNVDGTSPYGTQTSGRYLQRTAEVGRYAANLFGLYDMHGNVCEWCHSQSKSGETVVRGGAWLSNVRYSRSADRYPQFAKERRNKNGFRVLRAVPFKQK